ncbi:MAG: AAA family ATPase, partial [Lachnospiraceae bacterium]|nr:AAA family ATPase [Lachnospiraceae bacterium]
MLHSLHVENLALIDETEVSFKPGLNILTGETGAGKSLLVGSINLALGAKSDSDLIRTGEEYALVELNFESHDPELFLMLEKMEIPVDGCFVNISRRIMPGRSIIKINGESCNAKQLKAVTELLIDIHGQHEHQSLLDKKK